jgi:hypothetical protein
VQEVKYDEVDKVEMKYLLKGRKFLLYLYVLLNCGLGKIMALNAT